MDAIYRSEINRDVAPAAPGEFQPIPIGKMQVWPPVVLAPMAGVTNYPFRTVCREFGAGPGAVGRGEPFVEFGELQSSVGDCGPQLFSGGLPVGVAYPR